MQATHACTHTHTHRAMNRVTERMHYILSTNDRSLHKTSLIQKQEPDWPCGNEDNFEQFLLNKRTEIFQMVLSTLAVLYTQMEPFGFHSSCTTMHDTHKPNLKKHTCSLTFADVCSVLQYIHVLLHFLGHGCCK